MSIEIDLREQIPLYINGALTSDEKHSFESALKLDQELKREYLEFHEIESTFDRFEDVSEQHLEQIFKTITNNTQGINRMAERTSPPLKTSLVPEAQVEDSQPPSKPIPAPVPVPEPEPEPIETKDEKPPSIDLEIEIDRAEDDKNLHQESELLSILSSSRLAWIVAAAQFVLLLVVVFFTAPFSQNSGLSGEASDQISGVTTYNVVFADNATQKEIRELLVSLEIQIANGPTSIGLYTIFVKGSKKEAAKTFNKLKNSSLVLLAEPSFI